jgi:hypothetical protein
VSTLFPCTSFYCILWKCGGDYLLLIALWTTLSKGSRSARIIFNISDVYSSETWPVLRSDDNIGPFSLDHLLSFLLSSQHAVQRTVQSSQEA